MSILSEFNKAFPFVGSLPIWLDDILERDAQKPREKSVPAVNVLEAIKHYTLEVAIPGKEKSDFKISVDDQSVLTISMEHKEEKKEGEQGKVKRMEFNYSSFSRSFTLPSTVDASKITAAYTNGILSIHIPKLDAGETKPKVEVKVS